MVVALSGPEGETEVIMAGATDVTEVVGAGLMPDGAGLVNGCVCCIFTVAFGNADPPPLEGSTGRLMRAVSFFGEAGFETMPDAGCTAADDGGAGLRGMVGFPLSGGGFGGGIEPLSGFKEGGGGSGDPGGRGGGGGIEPEAGRMTFEVSFFGACGAGCTPDSGMFTRTVSRLATGPSVLGGSVMRMVSLLAGSSWGRLEGFSSAISV